LEPSRVAEVRQAAAHSQLSCFTANLAEEREIWLLSLARYMTSLSLHGDPARYPAGLQDLGSGLWAWLQPNGGLGESNAGLVVGAGESLLIDTLWDLPLTRRMLDAMAAPTAQAPIRRLVNTHADGDHCWGASRAGR
jgi:hypothetical protein